MSSLSLREQIDSRFFAPAYIHDSARQSYRHWWAHLGILLDLEYEHILNPNRHKRPYMYRWGRGAPSYCHTVNHTVVLPTGEEITYEWTSPHHPGWRQRGHKNGFRERHKFVQHGIEKKVDVDQARQDWREHKQFKRDKANRFRCHRCCGKWMKAQINRENRRANKKLIYSEKWDEIRTLAEPRDTWRWD
jgi:hypothetical protein